MTEASEIWWRALDFYSHLYRGEYIQDKEAFNSFCNGLPRVSEETSKELEGPVTADDLLVALKSM